ncbi:RagB/SusD family nutrient uptake outer membrane protein [Fodinibius salsisoli]|uniref:RagB/SusD family nutrient uptake outer membrane protein n=1 Tax=Fodinibius salsisoli TaxID=2820877 RepID=A0ABT3PTC7_9BACT|nr:RagB/SusD family nutrient uptake outer membrane protein [Fodinibius salsisoli]MCW9709110.1 RagB/SusD family nutrient uptake outer membrane protein [Fodinibius salsisoli]
MFIKNYKIVSAALLAMIVLFMASCVDNLNTSPLDNDIVTSEAVYETPEDYRQVLAKLYAGFAATGQQGPSGNADIQGIDEGFSSYIRQFWVAQEIPTDEAVVAWTDPGLPEFNYQSWGASNDFVMGMYSRIFYEITLANEFIRNANGNENSMVQSYNAEARFLRALSYWHALDFYGGGIPFVTEKDGVGAYNPQPASADSVFSYIENELLAIEDQLPATGQNEYGRAGQAAAWTLLAKLYLNAEVYTGEQRYSDALSYADKVIESGAYALEDNYQHLFLADNHTADGIIFPITFDGEHTKTYGGTNFIVHAAVGGDMSATEFGIDAGWAGHRTTPQLVDKFDQENDSRALFFTEGQELEIQDIEDFKQGYAITKWKNITSDGQPGSFPEFVDTDFPMFRLADVYLIYAEAVARGAEGGNTAKAVDLVNQIRERAFGDASQNITPGELTPEFILDERARELYWEGHRRTDLIRYGHFTSADYVWAWKGNTQEGAATSDHYALFPIPSSDVNSNTNLTQNLGY